MLLMIFLNSFPALKEFEMREEFACPDLAPLEHKQPLLRREEGVK
jgi:hypothetical protein